MVQNLRAFFIIHVFTIELIMCVKENIKRSSASQYQGSAQPKSPEISL